MIENVIVESSNWNSKDIGTIFETEEIHFTNARCLSKLMVELGIFPSTTKARLAGRIGKIPTGYTEFKASKKRRIFIWNPT